MLERRRAGVLLHPTSLPGAWDGGVLGTDARRFIDLLAAAGFSLWQMLPVGPVGPSLSPYQLSSAFAGNPRLIDPAGLAEAGWLPAGATMPGSAWSERAAAIDEAFERFRRDGGPARRAALLAFWQAERHWLLPYGLFRLCRERHGERGWWHWPQPIRDRSPAALAGLLSTGGERLRAVVFEQYLFASQWAALRAYGAARGVHLFGDLPIYMDLDSADVWWHRDLFQLGPDGQPTVVAGVPPDYFSTDGQVWGNPLYDWSRHAATGFRWWRARYAAALDRFGLLRLDHFRGLQAYWEVPAGAATARAGRWVEAPGDELLMAMGADQGGLALVAEDLGVITPEVRALRDRFGLPGMLILQFAFDGLPDNPYLPANHRELAVVYPGTHDNDTLRGWYRSSDEQVRDRVRRHFACDDQGAPSALLGAVWQSRARLAIFPWQDLLGLGSEARMNTPGTVAGNWTWRFEWSQVPTGASGSLRGLVTRSDRLVPERAAAGNPSQAASLA